MKINLELFKNLDKQKGEKIVFFLLSLIFIFSLIYAYSLALKRFNNYEFGKFDLGNMSQMVWNSANGNFMEVTDQFGYNMPRWGMSHVDPVLLLFVPIYKVYAHPMILVFAQHILILSAIFPIFGLVYMKTRNRLASFFVVLTYILYPAIGYTLVWTEYHGISFVAPLLIWLIWFLEKKNFLNKENSNKKNILIYWVLIILMLLGKEEIGVILALASVFLYFKNKRLAVQTFIVSTIFFVVSFFVIIPAYSDLRKESISKYISSVFVSKADVETVSQDNFFFIRYSYLGDTYPEMIKTVITRPAYVFKNTIDEAKIETLKGLFGPFGYFVALNPFWLVSTPDLAIVILSKDGIMAISNHRIAFVISALFISYIYVLGFIFKFLTNKKLSGKKVYFIVSTVSFIVLISTILHSNKYRNPIYVSGTSFFQNKIINVIFAQDESDERNPIIGNVYKAKLPDNNKICLDNTVNLVESINPQIYSGPDYLGAHTSLRWVNALFPTRYYDSDVYVADIFETKSADPIDAINWIDNKETMRRMVVLNNKKQTYACGRINMFVKGESKDTARNYDSEVIDDDLQISFEGGGVEYIEGTVKELVYRIHGYQIPSEIRLDEGVENDPFRIIVSKEQGDFRDKIGYWVLENYADSTYRYGFHDYMSYASYESLDTSAYGQKIYEEYTPVLGEFIPKGKYRLYYGIGDQVRASEVYLGDIEVK